MSLSPALFALLLPLLALACWSDVKERRVPNAYTVTGLLLALAMRASFGLEPFLMGLAGAGMMLVLGFALFASGGFGAGDAKLMIMVGAFLGAPQSLEAMAAIGIGGALFAVAYCAWQGSLWMRLGTTARFGIYLATLGRKGAKPWMDAVPGNSLPYALPIALGTLFTILS